MRALSPRLVRWLALAAIAVVASLVWAEYAGRNYLPHMFFTDTYDYAQMGRQVYRGEGFTSLQTFPYVLGFLAEHGISSEPPWPNTTRFPLMSVLHAISFSAVGPSDFGIALTGGVLQILCACAAFLLGERLFGRVAGLVAAILIGTDATQLRYSISGLLEPGAAFFLVTTALALAWLLDRPESRPAALVLGACLGLSFLQRYDLLAITPAAALVLVVARPTRRFATLSFVAIGFLVPTLPWFGRNLVSFGSLLGSTSVDRNILKGVVAGDVYGSSAPVDVWGLLFANYGRVLWKFVEGGAWVVEHRSALFGSGRFWLGAACLVAGLLLRSTTARLVWLFVLASFLSRFLLLSLMHHEVRFYTSYTPVMLVLVVGAAVALQSRLPGLLGGLVPRAAVGAAVIALVLSPKLAVSGLQPIGEHPVPARFSTLGSLTSPGDVVAARGPGPAWYGDRPTIRVAGGLGALRQADQLVSLDAVLVADRDRLHEELGAHPELGFRIGGSADGQSLWVRASAEASDAPPTIESPSPSPSASVAASEPAAGKKQRGTTPSNLLLITVDTLRADRLGVYGYRLDTSPTIDALAARGVRFADATVQWPKTWPEMASMLTGKYPASNGVQLFPRRPLPEGNVTLGEALAAAGFKTGAVVANANLSERFRYDQGFDLFVESWKEGLDRDAKAGRKQNVANNQIKRYTNATIVTDQALTLLDQLQTDQPFFLWLHYIDPHGPYQPPERYADLFAGEYEKQPVAPSLIPGYQRQNAPGEKQFSTDLGFYRSQYDREIRNLDDQLARLFGELEKRRLAASTLVVLTADHGESLGEHELYLEHGHGPYQPTAGVPLILAWRDRLPAGRVVTSPVGLVDLMPTLLELLDVEPPADLEGTSLVPMIESADGSGGPEWVFLQSGYDVPPQLAVRHGRWKLVHLRTARSREKFGPEFQLYDVVADPGETNNVAEAHPDVTEKMKVALAAWVAKQQQAQERSRTGGGDEVDLETLDGRTRKALEALGYVDK